jgi:hypothetical protein
MIQYNNKISKLAGLFIQTANEILGDPSMKIGEKYLVIQQLMSGIKPATKIYDKIEKQIKTYAKDNLYDNGTGVSDPVIYEGSEVLVKYVYNPPELNAPLLEEELKRAYSEINEEYDPKLFLKERTPKRTVIIQSILPS